MGVILGQNVPETPTPILSNYFSLLPLQINSGGGVTTQIPDICSLVWVGTHKNSYFHRMNKLICASRRRRTTTGSVVKRDREIFKNGVIFQKSGKINKSTKIPFFLTRRGCHNGEYSGRGRIIKHFPKNLDTWKK